MLSYMLPAEEKPPPMPSKTHMQLDLEARAARSTDRVTNGGVKRTIIKSQSRNTTLSNNTISTDSSISSISSTDLASGTPTERSRAKLCVNGVKTSLKRVSFGSSKGSMVETLIYESPLAEEQETSPVLETPSPFSINTDSETSESKKVRVTFFESEKPLVLPSPDPAEDFLLDVPCDVISMTSHSPIPDDHAPPYNRQARVIRLTGYVSSTDSGWDNPFRPDGDLSREADELVELIKGGKPITPTPGSVAPALPITADEADSVAETKQGGAVNGTSNDSSKPAAAVEVQRTTVVVPIDASQVEHVNIKKKPKCKCCVIQ